MRRAALLLAALLLLSGCSGTGPPTDTASTPGQTPTADRSPTVSSPSTPTAASPSVSVAETVVEPTVPWFFVGHDQPPRVFRTLNVDGSASKSFEGSTQVFVWNARPNRTLNVTLAYGPENATVYEEQRRFAADTALGFEMGQAGRYAVTVEHRNGSGTMVLDGDHFDCNDQAHAIWVNETGAVRESRVTTSMACSVTPE